MKLLYMNQGGGGGWPAIRYGDYDVLVFAEDKAKPPTGFRHVWRSNDSLPRMGILVRDEGRVIGNVEDLDVTKATVRPIVWFQLTRSDVYVVFFHLKSANEKAADAALRTAVKQLGEKIGLSNEPTPRVLWIGDLNRGDDAILTGPPVSATVLARGGGYANWDLDGALWSGPNPPQAQVISKAALDHGHLAIAIDFG